MTSWEGIRERIQGWKQENPTTRSYVRSLLVIIDKAKEWGIDPAMLKRASDSKLREITASAKEAIQAGDKTKLEEIFHLASELSIADLSFRLRSDKWEKIPVTKVLSGNTKFYRIDLSEAQFRLIRNATRRALTFKMDEEE